MAKTLSSTLSVRLTFLNQISQNRDLLVRNPVLFQGEWQRSPSDWDPPEVVPWQMDRRIEATGVRPTGVHGQSILEIPADGIQPPANRITFQNDATGTSFLIDGSTFKTIVQGSDIFFARTEASLEGSVLVGTLTVTGDNALEISRLLQREAAARAEEPT